jgi:hypothetical protein
MILTGLVLLLTTGAFCGCLSGSPWDVILATGAIGVLLTVLVELVLFLVFFTLELRSLRPKDEEFGPDELVLMVTKAPLVYYRGGNLFVPWNQFCGKLFLTNERFVFLSGWGHFNPQCLWLPLHQVEWAETFLVMGMRNGLCVRMAGGEEYLFNLGAINDPDAEGWAARIIRESRRPAEVEAGPAPPTPTGITNRSG